MSAHAVLGVEMRDAAGGEGAVQQDAVLPLDDGVIDAVEQEDRWAVGGDVHLQRHGVAHRLTALAVLAEEGTAAALMDVGRLHGHDGVDGGYEVGAQADRMRDTEGREEVGGGVGGSTHDEMTTRREAHSAEALGIDPEFLSMFADVLDGALDVAERVGVTMAATDEARVGDIGDDALDAVLEDKGGDAVVAEPFGDTDAFGLIVVPAVAAARADDDGRPLPRPLPREGGECWRGGGKIGDKGDAAGANGSAVPEPDGGALSIRLQRDEHQHEVSYQFPLNELHRL